MVLLMDGKISPIAVIGGGVPEMLGEEQVSVMFELWKRKWGISRIARELVYDRKTVRKWVKRWNAGDEVTCSRQVSAIEGRQLGRPRSIVASLDVDWLRDRFATHDGNADVVRQEINAKTGEKVSLRSVQRVLQGYRQVLQAEQLATVRFETPPGRQLQVDFGTKTVLIGGERTKVHFCVLTLGWSRKIFVRAWKAERQAHWFSTLEEAFLSFGGVPRELLVDNARALVKRNDGEGQVEFNAEFLAFCAHWGTNPRACRPYRARTKGKDESMVKYVKRNALAGRSFDSWSELEAHLETWTRDVADCRVHGTTRVRPDERFQEERKLLQPLRGQTRYLRRRIVNRRVQNDSTVAFWGNMYSVPWKLIGREVEVIAEGTELMVWDRGKEVARHPLATTPSAQRVINPLHLRGVIALQRTERGASSTTSEALQRPIGDSALLRPLEEYDVLCAGGAV